jgi:D-amino-acid dehydrogenase
MIIGAGITGVTTAYALAKAGHDVTVLDRHRYPAMETSFANGGQLSASNAEVWNSWSTVMKGLGWMMRPSAPLLVNPKPSWHKLSWMAEFCGEIRHHDAHTVETARLAIAARQHLFRIAEEEGIDFDLERRGILHVYHDERTFRAAAKGNELLLAAGLERYAVSAEEARAIEPALTGPLYAGFYTPSDCTGDIHKFTRGLAEACERLGVVFRQDCDVEHIEPGTDAVRITLAGPEAEVLLCDRLVVCAGVASRKFASSVGDRVNIYPVKGYSITVMLHDEASQNAAPHVSLLDESAKIVTSRLGPDRFRVAGTAEFNGFNRDIRNDRIAPLIEWSRKLFPNMETDVVVPWAGLRPMTPSMMPKVGPGRHPRILYNSGHGHLGWTLSAATAEMLSAQVH